MVIPANFYTFLKKDLLANSFATGLPPVVDLEKAATFRTTEFP